MKHIAGWFRRNNTIMAQAKDLQRQWQEMREESTGYKEGYDERGKSCDYLEDQLHRVARERDQERKKRIDAEVAHLDSYLDRREEAELERAAAELVDIYLENAANEEE